MLLVQHGPPICKSKTPFFTVIILPETLAEFCESSCFWSSSALLLQVSPRCYNSFFMKVVAIRGAVTVNNNEVEEIKSAAVGMVKQIIEKNQFAQEDIVMVFMTMTSDLTAYNASAAIRLGMSWDDVPFFTSLEPDITGSLKRCIRILIQIQSNKAKDQIHHVYLGEAANLRPDLSSK
jgi:chorismate mutase